ncbi:MAG TPA: peptide-methionine (S)-S-oxide reductase, partial [Terriglobales bacterium]|nr:peptide-methionine (S)-S-oxide reductase [Terriglobales bacterium]
MSTRFVGLILTSALSVAILACSARAAVPKVPPAANDVQLASKAGEQKAVFAGGCFWGTQAVFERVKGVLKTTAGYAGGTRETATYDQVTTETTGH